MNPIEAPDRCLSVRELARRWAVSPRKVRDMIRRRLLAAFDVGRSRRQLRISVAAIAECEQKLAVRPAPGRGRRRHEIDADVAALLES